MRTRRGVCYPRPNANVTTTSMTTTMFFHNKTNTPNAKLSFPSSKLPSLEENVNGFTFRNDKVTLPRRKRAKVSPESSSSSGTGDGCSGTDFFDFLPDDLVICILAKLSSSATCPADFVNVLITCKRFNGLGMNSMVLSRASPKTFSIKAKNWSDSAHRFIKVCSDAGNVDASYTLGMIRFYCVQNRGSGASLMAKAAINSHAQALYSLAVIQFNGSGGTKSDKDLRVGVALCARAAFLGHVDALRELGHCLQDGYGVRQNVPEGRRFLVQANARELAAALSSTSPPSWIPPARHAGPNTCIQQQAGSSSSSNGNVVGCPLLSDFGCNVPAPEAHPANKFLTEWYSGRAVGPGLRLCSHAGCGRPETRKHEFRRCSVCGAVNYCSRACQALDWKLRHKVECTPMPRWPEDNNNNNINNNNDNLVDGVVVNVDGMDIDEDGLNQGDES